jgi:cyanophycinase
MRRLDRFILACCLLVFLLSSTLLRADGTLQRIDPTGARGSLVIAGGGKLPAAVIDRFIAQAGGDDARLVIIPTASIRADDPAQQEQLLAPWQARPHATLEVLHTRDRKRADTDKFVRPLIKATGVWFGGGQQQRIADAYVDTRLEEELLKLLDRGGVIGGTSAGAAIQSKVMIASGKTEAVISTGFDLLPGTIIDQHFSQRDRIGRLMGAVDRFPGQLGLGIDEETALLVQGRRMQVVGAGKVTLCLGKTDDHEAKQVVFEAGRLIDLTALRRLARDRTGPLFPAKTPGLPEVKQGALVIVGGGGMPKEVMERFLALAGGRDALIVILPTAVSDPLPPNAGAGMFTRAGATNVKVLTARRLKDVESADNLRWLRKADAIWFGGGRQWRFVDAYEGTRALPLMHRVLARGGVIGGSSAGASIQAGYLARGDPLGNRDIMADGYERGLGFLPGVAVDQHFAQRNRFGDMASLVDRYPQLLGIGIDEATALVVEGHVGTVMGPGQVHFYDRRDQPAAGAVDHISVGKGVQFDLQKRSLVDKQASDRE